MSCDFNWIQALGIRFPNRRLYMGAQKTAKWNNDINRLELAFDGAPIDIPAELGTHWQSAVVSGLTVTRTASTNGVRVQLKGVLDIMANVVPIMEQDLRIHNYGVTEDESVAHLDIGFKVYDLASAAACRCDAPSYVSSDILGTDCAVARFGRRVGGIPMVTASAS